MTLDLNPNDMSHVIAADREHVWHHLSQHKQYETIDPRVYVEGQLETRKWQDQSGADRYTTEVVLRPFRSELTMLDGRGEGGGAERGGMDRGGSSQIDDEIPF